MSRIPDESGAITLRQLWHHTSELLGARHEARWICEVATALDGAEFDASLDQQLTERMVRHHDAMLARYQAGEPIQYVLGRWGFRRLDLAIDRRVLIPRPETELVVDEVIRLVADRSGPIAIADLGTGSGAIGLALADELPRDATTIWITEPEEASLLVARANLAGLGRAATNVIAAVGSWCAALPTNVAFDVIVSNPPYVAEGSPLLDRQVVAWEPGRALFAGPQGLDAYNAIVPAARSHLADDGWLVLEIGTDQGDAVSALCRRNGYADIEVLPDLAGHDRIVVARAR